MSKCYEFPSFGIYIFLVEVKHQYVVENVYFSDDISLGLVLALFYLKKVIALITAHQRSGWSAMFCIRI